MVQMSINDFIKLLGLPSPDILLHQFDIFSIRVPLLSGSLVFRRTLMCDLKIETSLVLWKFPRQRQRRLPGQQERSRGIHRIWLRSQSCQQHTSDWADSYSDIECRLTRH